MSLDSEIKDAQLHTFQKIFCLLSANCYRSFPQDHWQDTCCTQVLPTKSLFIYIILKTSSYKVTYLELSLKLNSSYYNTIGFISFQVFKIKRHRLPNSVTMQVPGYVPQQSAATCCMCFSLFLKHHVCQSSCHSELRECY